MIEFIHKNILKNHYKYAPHAQENIRKHHHDEKRAGIYKNGSK